MDERDWESLTEDIIDLFDSYPLSDNVSNIQNRTVRFVESLRTSFELKNQKRLASHHSHN